MDKAVLGYCRLGYFRLGVINDAWDRLVKTVESMGGASFAATRRRLMLMARDSTTGWYDKAYEESDIEIVVLSKASQQIALSCGTYVRGDAVGLTADVLWEGDQILVNGQYYEVETVKEHYLGDSFSHRECELTLLLMESLSGKTYTKSTVEDARYRTKVYLETYLRSAYLPNFIAAYGSPDNSLVRVFKEKGIDLVFAILDPEPSKAIPDSDHYPIGYEEHVPIETYCINKDNIDGVKLQTQACMELRYITENYPEGSLRSLDEMRPNRKDLGSTTLFSQRFIVKYERDLT